MEGTTPPASPLRRLPQCHLLIRLKQRFRSRRGRPPAFSIPAIRCFGIPLPSNVPIPSGLTCIGVD